MSLFLWKCEYWKSSCLLLFQEVLSCERYTLIRPIEETSVISSSEIKQRGADKSLAWPTSHCHRMELIVSLKRGVSSCAELQVVSCYRSLKEACQVTRVISTTSRRELSSSFFPARQAAKLNSCHSDRNITGTCTILCHDQKLGGPI